jgi:hypothetical protein
LEIVDFKFFEKIIRQEKGTARREAKENTLWRGTAKSNLTAVSEAANE